MDITVRDNSGRNRLILIPDNGMQRTADRAVEWSQGNKQSLKFQQNSIYNDFFIPDQ